MRDRIIDATAELLVEYGQQVSMSKIAVKAKVATGSLYNYFESKEVLLKAVYTKLARQVAENLEQGDAPQAPPKRRLELYIDSYIDFFWEDTKRAILFEYLSNIPILTSDELIDTFRSSSDLIAGIIEELQEVGALICGRPVLLGGFIGGAIRNALKWHRVYDLPLTAVDRDQIKTMCINAIVKTR